MINTQKDIQKRLRDTYRIKNIKKNIIKTLKKTRYNKTKYY